MGSINSETPYLHQVKWRGTLYFLTKRSTWNISIFFDERSTITHPNQTGIQWRRGGVLHTRMEGEGYQKLQL